MDASTVLWERWRAQVKELLPGIHGHQKKTLAFFVIGIVLSGSAVLQRVAESISLQAIKLILFTAYLFVNLLLDGVLLCAFKMYQGERALQTLPSLFPMHHPCWRRAKNSLSEPSWSGGT